MPTCVIVGAIVVSCLVDPATKPTAAQAARILEQAPGISNRSHVYTLTVDERPRVILIPRIQVTAPKPIEPRRLDGTPMSQSPQVYGIPYPWTPLTWAILHAGSGGSK